MAEKHLKKGTYGYIRAYKKYHLIVSVLWACLVAAVFTAGVLIFKTRLNWLTLAAALLLLPAAKAWIASIVMIPYKTDEPEHFEKISAMVKDMPAEVYSDLVLTKYEGAMMISVLVLYDDNFFAYVPKQRKTPDQIRQYLNEIIKEAGGSSKALVYNDFNKYEKAIQRLSRQE